MYSYNNGYPAPLPKRIVLEDGTTRTSLHEHGPVQLAEWGLVPAQPKPTPAQDQVVEWGGNDWVVSDKTPEKIEQDEMDARAALPPVERWQFATACMLAGVITPAEAQAWGPGNSLPDQVEAALEAAIPHQGQLAAAKVKALAVARISRANPLIEILRAQTAFNLTPEEADNLFIAAAALE